MALMSLRSYRRKLKNNRRGFRKYLNKLEKEPPRGLDSKVEQLNSYLWKEIDCLSCANCCKVMTPTYTRKDMLRIANFLNMRVKAFQDKWLKFDKSSGDWINKSTPCQFLDLATNKCKIYDVRPADCAGFPHLTKKRTVEYLHVHKQNLDYCPATYRMVEQMITKVPVQ